MRARIIFGDCRSRIDQIVVAIDFAFIQRFERMQSIPRLSNDVETRLIASLPGFRGCSRISRRELFAFQH
ncbi:hypothetical protein [Leptolyngbya sp. NIES-2104]|uniref:hypothetical protein n=1 Tax=Leptolyngbya sp. NIES-2104 TaxID=1552121 RepID=UPI0006EC6BD9|nr:hypothetical protein [Leptolyngbya sp. NIES-2104]GAP96172.1 hypothetical protein NIES2104_27070 [Leptolyngbya sp. NIES-2104]